MVLTHKLLTSRSTRYEQRLFAADGIKLLEEAAKWNAGLETVILQENVTLDFPLPAGVRIVSVSRQLMRQISMMETPQGAIFLCRIPEPQPLAVQPGSIILDGLQDPGNLGTILRTADALEVQVTLTEGCADPYNPKTVRAAMGAVFRSIPVQAEREEVVTQCRERKIPLFVTALGEKAKDLREAPLKQAVTVIGSEGRGVSSFYSDRADRNVLIPMNPRCESLNAATAATILMWELRR